MSTPSPSPSPPPPQPPPPSSSPPSNPTKAPKPLPWTHQETVVLIQAYQEKWYSLKRGQLKSTQWEEVAANIARRCGYHHQQQPPKSAVQCRHKMEKLRRRYREEKRRVAAGGRCSWLYFNLLDSLECGPQPLAARPLTLIPPRDEDDDDEEEEEEEEEVDDGYRSKSQSIDYILRKPAMVNRFAGSEPGISAEEEEAVRKRKREGMDVVGGLELAEEIRGFGERMMWMERKKMQMVKEIEGWRMEMESKRMEMILESQRKIVGVIAAAFDSHKKKESNLEQQQQLRQF